MSSAFDVVVVGGGTAGCVLAARLSEDENRSVCLVEAGPDYGPRANWPTELLDPGGIPESHQWDPDESPFTPLRTKVIGGFSAMATRSSAAEKYLGDMALSTPRVPGPVVGQVATDVASPG